MAELVESTTLLTWQALKGLEGSNPSLSATLRAAKCAPRSPKGEVGQKNNKGCALRGKPSAYNPLSGKFGKLYNFETKFRTDSSANIGGTPLMVVTCSELSFMANVSSMMSRTDSATRMHPILFLRS